MLPGKRSCAARRQADLRGTQVRCPGRSEALPSRRRQAGGEARAAEQATHRTTPPPSATTGLALPQGPCTHTKLLASVACGSLSSERGFPVTAPLSVRQLPFPSRVIRTPGRRGIIFLRSLQPGHLTQVGICTSGPYPLTGSVRRHAISNLIRGSSS